MESMVTVPDRARTFTFDLVLFVRVPVGWGLTKRRNQQLSWWEGIIIEDVDDLWEPWMREADRLQTGAPIYVGSATAGMLQPPSRLLWVRRTMIGQPPPLQAPFGILGDRLAAGHREMEVIAAPGHCDHHIVLYDVQERLLLAGDAFMGAHFATPNPDVDSRRCLETLERLLELDIEILVEGLGQIHTLRPDIPEVPGVVVQCDPKQALREKLRFLEWQRDQIETGIREGLPIHAIEATYFPWSQPWSWENLGHQMVRLFSLGHFSRTEMVRSFVRHPEARQVLHTVYELRLYESSSRGGADQLE